MKNLRDSHIVVSKQFDLLKNPRTSFRVEEQSNLYFILIIVAGCVNSFMISG